MSVIPRNSEYLDHPSPPVRVMGGSSPRYPPMHDGLDIFVDLYLRCMPEADGLDFGRRAARLADDIRRLEEREEACEEPGAKGD